MDRLVDTVDPIGTFDPTLVPVVALPEAEFHLWPTRRTRNRDRQVATTSDLEADVDLESGPGDADNDEENGEAISPSSSETEYDEGCSAQAPEVDIHDTMADDLEQLAQAREGDAVAEISSADSNDYQSVADEYIGDFDEDIHDDLDDASNKGQQRELPSDDSDDRMSSSESGSDDVANNSGGCQAAVAIFDIPDGGGRIIYYRNGHFVAECPKPAHGTRCRLARTSCSSTSRSAQGKPWGLMKGWLSKGFSSAVPTSRDHVMNRNVFPTYEARVNHRAELAALPGSERVLNHESPPWQPEPRGRP